MSNNQAAISNASNENVSMVLNQENSPASSTTKGCGDSLQRQNPGRSIRNSVCSVNSSCSESSSLVLRSSASILAQTKINDLGMNKLRFTSLDLHGRENETAMLQSSLTRLTKPKSQGGTKRELILISGFSGTGKSALASSLRDPVERRQGAFVSGKFDALLQGEPYSAISSICCQICKKLSPFGGEETSMSTENTTSKPDFQGIEKIFLQRMNERELLSLQNIVPDLTHIVSSDDKTTLQDISTNQSSLEMKRHLLGTFQKFFGIVSSQISLLVIVLDDLQWADDPSLELLESLITEESLENLLVVGSYRSNEVDETHTLSKCVKGLKEHDVCPKMTEIELKNLSIQATNEILMALLNIDDKSRTMPLAKICHKRTLGNVYFLLTFVTMMKEKDIIEYDLMTFTWTWDINNVENNTKSTGNVVDLLKEKMKKATEAVNELLQMASCLGSNFERQTLLLVWTKLSSSINTCNLEGKVSFDTLLSQCIEDGYFEMVGCSSCRFSHDRVQEAAMALIPGNKARLLQHDIGILLLSELQEDELENNIFTVANLLNISHARDIEIAQTNLFAAERAKSLSAFSNAAQYASKGIDILPLDSWECHRQLYLNLYSIGAETECYLGNIEKAEYYCNKVLEQRNTSLAEKFRLYIVLIEIKDSAGQPQEAVDICLRLLKQSGCKFPKRKQRQKLQAITGILKLQNYSAPEIILSKPRLADSEKVMLMNLMLRLSVMAYRSLNFNLSLLSTIRRVQWSMQYGICDESAPSLASIGFILMHRLGKVKEGIRYGEIAISLLEKAPKNFHYSQAISLLYCHIFCWVRPHLSILNDLMDGYTKGMEMGNVDFSMWNISAYIWVQLFGGKELRTVDEDCSIYFPQVEGLKKQQTSIVLSALWQTVDNLVGKSDNTTTLTGERMHEDKLMSEVMTSSSSSMLSLFSTYKSFLCIIFGEHELGAQIAMERGDDILKEVPGQLTCQIDPFIRGLSLYAMARDTKKKHFKKHAKRARSKLRSWVKKGFVNVVHHLKLLDAEDEALSGRKDRADKIFREACTMAVRSGCTQDSALAYERYAEFLLESSDRHTIADAVFYLEKAIRLYLRWGATAKVKKMCGKYSGILSESTLALSDYK